MPSSTSSSDAGWWERPLPQSRIGAALAVAAVLFLLAMVAWESGWRAYGAVPGIRNSEGLWAAQRRRINRIRGKWHASQHCHSGQQAVEGPDGDSFVAAGIGDHWTSGG